MNSIGFEDSKGNIPIFRKYMVRNCWTYIKIAILIQYLSIFVWTKWLLRATLLLATNFLFMMILPHLDNE